MNQLFDSLNDDESPNQEPDAWERVWGIRNPVEHQKSQFTRHEQTERVNT